MPQQFSPFNWSTWGPKYQQSVSDAQKAVGVVSDPTLPNIAQGVNKIGEFLEGSAWQGGSPGISQSVPGNDGFGNAFYDMPAQLQNVDVNARNGMALSAAGLANTADILSWINGTSTPLGYLEFGKFSADGAASVIWDYDGLPQTGYEAGDALSDAGIFGRRSLDYHVFRRADAPMFLCYYAGDESLAVSPPLPDLRSVDPSTQMPGESDVAFLNRVAGLLVWGNPTYGVAVAGTQVVLSDGALVYYFYSPYALSSSWYKRLWDYVPSSGPPFRNGIDDFIRVLTLLPLQF